MGILFKVEAHIDKVIEDFSKEKKAKLPKSISKKFLRERNCWELNLSGRLNKNFRLFIRNSERLSKVVKDMGDRYGFEGCNHAINAAKAFCKKYSEPKIHEGEPFYLGELGLFVIEIPKDEDREKFNNFICDEYEHKSLSTEIKPNC